MESEVMQWRPVVGYEGLYSISQCGDIRSEDTVIKRKDGTSCFKKSAPLKPTNGKSLYQTARLCDERGQKTHYIHAMVLEAFIGPRPDGLDACHRDGDRQNNRVENLRWDTRAANHADKRLHGTAPIGEKHPHAKLTNEAVQAMRGLRATGLAFNKIAQLANVSTMTAYRAITGKCWSHI